MTGGESLTGIQIERLMMEYFDAGEYLAAALGCLDRAVVTMPQVGEGFGTRARRVVDEVRALRKELNTIYNDLWDVSPDE